MKKVRGVTKRVGRFLNDYFLCREEEGRKEEVKRLQLYTVLSMCRLGDVQVEDLRIR